MDTDRRRWLSTLKTASVSSISIVRLHFSLLSAIKCLVVEKPRPSQSHEVLSGSPRPGDSHNVDGVPGRYTRWLPQGGIKSCILHLYVRAGPLILELDTETKKLYTDKGECIPLEVSERHNFEMPDENTCRLELLQAKRLSILASALIRFIRESVQVLGILQVSYSFSITLEPLNELDDRGNMTWRVEFYSPRTSLGARKVTFRTTATLFLPLPP